MSQPLQAIMTATPPIAENLSTTQTCLFLFGIFSASGG